MYTTRLSLMNRVKNRDEIAWQEFYDLYRPLIYRYARRRGLGHPDAEDIVAQCFEKLTVSLPEFDYQPARGRFKSWLKTIVHHRIHDLMRRKRPQTASELEPPAADDDCLWERTWRLELLHYCVQQARAEVSARNFEIFHLNVYEEWSPKKIAGTLDLTEAQVYRAKHKVLQKVREKMAQYLQS